MKRTLLAGALFSLGLLSPAEAHIGSPDVFFDGKIGPYPASVTVRVPSVVPGRAAIEIRPSSGEVSGASFRPLYSSSRVKESPPPESAVQIKGEPGLWRGELWLMRSGGYSVELTLHGNQGDGVAEIPINSVATHQLPMPPMLGFILSVLGVALGIGGLAIVYAAAAESTLPAEQTADSRLRRKGIIATAVAALVLILAVLGGKYWWEQEEARFRRHVREGAWPDLSVTVRAGAPNVLNLVLGEKAYGRNEAIPLALDHGKLLHLFLIGEKAFAHLHPVRKGGKEFELALPPLPAGNYKVMVDLTLETTGMSSTASGTVQIPAQDGPVAPGGSGNETPAEDPDDSWAMRQDAKANGENEANETVSDTADGLRLEWEPHAPLRAQHDAGLRFRALDQNGNTVPLEPYMGMLSHAAVLRDDGKVFSHLHPAGNFSMAAQMLFLSKRSAETGNAMDHAMMHHGGGSTTDTVSSFYLPYEFPAAGKYRLWVQFKSAGKVYTGFFRANVAP